MKRYLFVDWNTDYKKLMSESEIIQETLDVIKEDIINCLDDSKIVTACVNTLIKLCTSRTQFKDSKDILESYSYGVVDLLDLQSKLEDVKQYFENKKCCTNDIRIVLDMINNEVNKNE